MLAWVYQALSTLPKTYQDKVLLMCCQCVANVLLTQVESFGMHYNASGIIFNGMKLEAIGVLLMCC